MLQSVLMPLFYFESWDTMWFQIQEMLHIEKGAEEQIPDELAAYNPLVPKGQRIGCDDDDRNSGSEPAPDGTSRTGGH